MTDDTWGGSLERAPIAVLAVHGRTQGPADMRVIADRIGFAPARFYAPTAPGNTWYPRPFLAPIAENQPDLDDALAAVDRSLAAIEADGFAHDRVVLLGFSQGACLLAHHLLSATRAPAAAVLFTGGYVGERPEPPGEGTAARLTGTPVLMRSIEHDPWVSPVRVNDTARVLEQRGAVVDLRIDPGSTHIITDEAIDSANGLLAEIASRAARHA